MVTPAQAPARASEYAAGACKRHRDTAAGRAGDNASMIEIDKFREPERFVTMGQLHCMKDVRDMIYYAIYGNTCTVQYNTV